MHPERCLRVEHGRYYRIGFILKTALFCQKMDQDINLKPFSSVTAQEARFKRSSLAEERQKGRQRNTKRDECAFWCKKTAEHVFPRMF